MPVRIFDSRIPFPNHQPRFQSSFARRIKFPHHIGKEANLARFHMQLRGNSFVARTRNLRPDARVEITRDQPGEIAIDRIAKQQLLRARRTRRVNRHTPMCGPALQCSRHIRKQRPLQLTRLEARLPYLPLQAFQRRRLPVPIHQPEDILESNGNEGRWSHRHIVLVPSETGRRQAWRVRVLLRSIFYVKHRKIPQQAALCQRLLETFRVLLELSNAAPEERLEMRARIRKQLLGDQRDGRNRALHIKQVKARKRRPRLGRRHAPSVVSTRVPRYAEPKQSGWYSRSTPDSV